MLGRLRMGVQETIDAYLELAKGVFRERTQTLFMPGHVRALVGAHRFSGEKLAAAVKRVVKRETGNEDTPFFNKEEEQCRVFVCATRTANTALAIMRSYRSDEEDSAQGTIWEVARATSAAPTFFPPVKFGNPPAEYVDGALVHNNPIRLVMGEINKVWGCERELCCVVSIGTGTPVTPKLGSMGVSVLKACAKLATNAENIARGFKADEGGRLHKEGKYFRFNVAQGLQAVKLEEWQAFDLMDAATKAYLRDAEVEVDTCARRLGQVTASEPEASPQPPATTAAPEYIDISRVSSRYFTGRRKVLTELEGYFRAARRANPQVAVLIGLGGIGKTQTALRYFERRKAAYTIALFVECNTKQEAIAAFVRFAHLVVDEELRQCPDSTYIEAVKKLGFSGLLDEQDQANQSSAESQTRVVDAVKRWLGRQQKPFLIIFDNADDPAAVNLDQLIPRHQDGDILITTRDKGAQAFGQAFPIDEMNEKDAIDLLAHASNMAFTSKQHREAARITEVLGYLPLAIDQAGGYLTSSDSDLANFLPTYELHARSLLSQLPNDGFLGYKHSAFTTWEMSFKRLEVLSPKSASLLQVLGFLNNWDICDLLYKSRNTGEEPTVPAFLRDNNEWNLQADGFSFHEAFSVLLKLCLVKRDENIPELRTYNIHPVVHVWIRERLDSPRRAQYARDALLLVARALPSLQQSSASAWAIHRRLHPHIQAVWSNIKRHVPASEDGREPAFLQALHIMATSFRQQGHYHVAEEILVRAYQGNKMAYGPVDPKTLDSATRLASIYDIRGDLKNAEELYRFVYAGLTEVLGADNRKTLAALQSLANVLKYRGQSEEAEKFYKEALVGRRKFGEADPDALETMDSLASLYFSSNRAKEAEPLRRFVLKTREELLGAENPETLEAMLDMGMLYSGLGKNELTVQLFEKAYENRHTLLNSQHTTKTLSALLMIAAYYANLGQTERAEAMYREVLARQQFLLGEQHLDTIWTQCCLGVVLFTKERSQESVERVEKALVDIEAKLGPDHLDTLWVAHALAIVYECWNKLEEAEQLQERVVKGYLAELGPDHVNTLYMINDLGDCYSRGKKTKKAAENFHIAYEGKLKKFGFRSPHTLYTATLLASAMRELGNEKESEELFKKVLDTTIDLLGRDHADVAVCMMYLADLYVSQHRFEEARDLYEEVYQTRANLQGEDHNNTRHTKQLLDEMKRRIEFPNAPNERSPVEKPTEARMEPRHVSFRPRRVRSMRWHH
ncbi:uncharacterized protein BJX67DRAFT_77366 [Aspergillus lucknowensis]|uniref:PNPLA domain-containing protein n=1 Tax=Aspergillus lucknowensis TaxID=176173 RepID=A0ABR4LTA5_9EURO